MLRVCTFRGAGICLEGEVAVEKLVYWIDLTATGGLGSPRGLEVAIGWANDVRLLRRLGLQASVVAWTTSHIKANDIQRSAISATSSNSNSATLQAPPR